MKCEYCDTDLIIVKNRMKSEINSTDIFSEQTLVCVNSTCSLYAGPDLENPLHVAKTVETKVS